MQLDRRAAMERAPRPSGHGIAASRNAEIVNAGIGRAPTLAIMHEHSAQPCRFDHVAECFCSRTAIIFQKHDNAAGLEKAANRREKTSMQLPVFVVEAQFTRRNIDEMWWIAYHQIP